VAYVRGLQGNDLSQGVMATGKHQKARSPWWGSARVVEGAERSFLSRTRQHS
jgi:hypothetical protein